MSWIATIVFCVLAFTCAGCMLIAHAEDYRVPLPRPQPIDRQPVDPPPPDPSSTDLCELFGCHGAIIFPGMLESRRAKPERKPRR